MPEKSEIKNNVPVIPGRRVELAGTNFAVILQSMDPGETLTAMAVLASNLYVGLRRAEGFKDE